MSVVKFLLFNIFCFFFMRLFNDVWLYAQCSLINICIWKSLGCLGFSFDFPKSKEGNKEWIWWWESCSERPRIVIRGNSRVGKVSKFVNRKCLGFGPRLGWGAFFLNYVPRLLHYCLTFKFGVHNTSWFMASIRIICSFLKKKKKLSGPINLSHKRILKPVTCFHTTNTECELNYQSRPQLKNI